MERLENWIEYDLKASDRKFPYSTFIELFRQINSAGAGRLVASCTKRTSSKFWNPKFGIKIKTKRWTSQSYPNNSIKTTFPHHDKVKIELTVNVLIE